jgi:hypothetical protein
MNKFDKLIRSGIFRITIPAQSPAFRGLNDGENVLRFMLDITGSLSNCQRLTAGTFDSSGIRVPTRKTMTHFPVQYNMNITGRRSQGPSPELSHEIDPLFEHSWERHRDPSF